MSSTARPLRGALLAALAAAALALAGCGSSAPAPAPAPPSAAPAASAAVDRAAAGDTFCVQVVGADPTCGDGTSVGFPVPVRAAPVDGKQAAAIATACVQAAIGIEATGIAYRVVVDPTKPADQQPALTAGGDPVCFAPPGDAESPLLAGSVGGAWDGTWLIEFTGDGTARIRLRQVDETAIVDYPVVKGGDLTRAAAGGVTLTVGYTARPNGDALITLGAE